MTTPSKQQALEALDSMDDFARMTLGVDAAGPREVLRRYIESTAAEKSPSPGPAGVPGTSSEQPKEPK
jgi:hypothetical protein